MSEKEEMLIDTGTSLVKKYGAIFPVDELCAMANISKKTFYSHFATKNQLIEQIIQKLIRKWEHESELHTADCSDLRSSFMCIFLYHLEEITSFNTNFFSGLKLKFPQEYLLIDDYLRQVRLRLLKILKEGQQVHKVSTKYNLELFLEKETAFFEYLCTKHYIFVNKEDYVKLLELSLSGLLIP